MRNAPGNQAANRAANPEQERWIGRLARLGHLAKGLIYGLVGILAIKAAAGSGGQVGGGKNAAQSLAGDTFGTIVLVLVGAGLLGYATWRMIQSIKDTENAGSDAKGIAKRIGFAGSGIMNGAIGVTALQMAFGSSGSGGGAKTFAAQLMAQPFGQVLVGAIGVGVIAAGLYQFKKAYTKSFLRELDTHELSRRQRDWIELLGRIGFAARGVVFPIIGFSLLQAAMSSSPGQVKGIGGALHEVASQTFGQVLLVVVAAGLVAYAAYLLPTAKYRRLGTAG